MKKLKFKLTTIDNPFDPFEDYDSWLAFDHQLGYYSNELLARVCFSSEELSDLDQDQAVEQAIDDIIRVDPLLIYRKVSKEVSVSTV